MRQSRTRKPQNPLIRKNGSQLIELMRFLSWQLTKRCFFIGSRVHVLHLCQACCPLKDSLFINFGTVPKLSTTNALIGMIHSWAKSADGNESTMRVVLFDFRKAFDLIGHHVLAWKLSCYDIPGSISCQIIAELKAARRATQRSPIGIMGKKRKPMSSRRSVTSLRGPGERNFNAVSHKQTRASIHHGGRCAVMLEGLRQRNRSMEEKYLF